MTSQTELEFASHTDTGLVRSHNEDAIVICAEAGLAVLADGMGGYNSGEVASQMSVDLVSQQIMEKQSLSWMPRLPWQNSVPAKWISEAIIYANQKVITHASQHPDNYGMGTTIVVALCHQDRLVVGHVGDSRAYRYRGGVLCMITHDHSVLQSQIDAGLVSEAEAHFSPIKNLITRAIGSHMDIEVEVHDHQLQEGDIYLLCSDGLSDMLELQQMQLALQELSGDLDMCCKTLVYLANRQGGLDNISIILFRVKKLHERGLMEYIFAS
ncbi:MAG: Stp1/IreP family PP2C-type Ser/Thr phosphatase [Undibacterium sp.]|nr:Stp1/IreP family PP2C-type Ser/Thr phosphatase [Undibacterium sp.]